MTTEEPVRVAVIGGGCASMTAAFELTRPEHNGRYEVTVYQLGWRLGGKGASGRGPNGRIEEHGLHVWMGFYENAFGLIRDCYAELDRDPATCPITGWQDAFFPEPTVGFSDRDKDGQWIHRTAEFPSAPGLPGDPIEDKNPFTVRGYLMHTVELLRTLLVGVRRIEDGGRDSATETPPGIYTFIEEFARNESSIDRDKVIEQITNLFRVGVLSTTAGLISAVGVLGVIIKSLPTYPQNVVLELLERLASAVRNQLESILSRDQEIEYRWQVIDLVIAIIAGIVRHGLAYHPKGFDAINHYECLEWLEENGASPKSTGSGFVRGLYDLAFAYGKEGPEPGLAAGQAIRGALRMLFTYRGSLFWKMQAGMGDVVFAPLYEVLKARGVRFEFFHRLENVAISEGTAPDGTEAPFVESLQFAVQAKVKRGKQYEPLISVNGLPCWPSKPDYAQLSGARRLQQERVDFESDWETGKAATKVLKVADDFDFVVLGLGIGAVPATCQEILDRDERWRAMVDNVTTVETQAFQLWLRDDMKTLGWDSGQLTLSAYVNPFNTWADMSHLIPEESWQTPPRAIAYFCNRLPPEPVLDPSDPGYPAKRDAEVRENVLHFLDQDIGHLWPDAVDEHSRFRWELLVDSDDPENESDPDESRIDGQYRVASVNRSDRYVLAAPGSLEHRISPLDRTYDNLTIAGDWTDCGFNEGCVEAAVMSGRLAAHAISLAPALEDIVGYDHP